MKNIINVGEKLKNARISCNLTQEEASEKAGCAPRYIGLLETNQSMGSIPLILKLCSIYGITPNDLYADYLDLESNTDLTKIIGYFKLNDEHKKIIENSISFMNKLEKN